MAMNTAHTDGGVVIHQGEIILLHAPSTVLSFSGSDELKRYPELTGNSYLTTHRLIFLTKGSKSDLKSFSFPFCVLSEVDVEQPVFGSNYLKGKVRAQPNGNWRGEAKFKLQFKAGGAIDFAQGMLKAIHIARQVSAQNQYWNEPPPAYAAATFMAAPTEYYAPPPSYYGWNYSPMTGYNFPPPEAGTVYINEAPPPYPGIGGGYQNPTGPTGPTGYQYPSGPTAYQYPGGPTGYQYPSGPTGYQYPNGPTGIIQQQAIILAGVNNGYAPPPSYSPNGQPGQQQGYYAPPQYTPGMANGNNATAPPYTEHYDKKQN